MPDPDLKGVVGVDPGFVMVDRAGDTGSGGAALI